MDGSERGTRRRLLLRELHELGYADQRTIFRDLAHALIFGGRAPRNANNGQSAARGNDIAACLIADIHSLLRAAPSPSASAARLCVDDMDAEPVHDAKGPRGPSKRREQRP